MYKWIFVSLFSLILLFSVVYAYTHTGGLDANGGHWNRETNVYHYHTQPNTDVTEETTVAPVQTVAPAMPYPVLDFSEDTEYQVVRIVDGDTVLISYEGVETSVRLIGIDTPETVHPTKPIGPYGKEASTFTRNLLQGESVYLRFGAEKTDFYGRMLAFLYRVDDGLFVNLEIVRQGYGEVETDYPFEYMDLFLHYEERALLTEKGLWTYVHYDPADLNEDGVVNILDLVIVANALGK